MGKVSENKLMKETKLYETAFQLFIQKGTHQTTIDDIVKQAGVAKGTFYLYFKDKYEIIDKLIGQHANKLFNQAIEKLSEEKETYSGTIYLGKIVDYIVDELSEDKELMNFIHKNLSYGVFKSLTLNTSNQDKSRYVLEMIISHLEQTGIYMKNPEITIFMVMELVSGACYNSIMFEQPLPIQQFKPYLHGAIRCLILNG